MIQDIAPRRFENTYQNVPPAKESVALCYREARCLLKKTAEGIVFPVFAQLEGIKENLYTDCTYLFSVDEERYYLVQGIREKEPEDFYMESVQVFRRANPKYRAFAGITGYQLFQWYKKNHFCGKCGSVLHSDMRERMLKCEACGNRVYPRICPAVIIALTDGNRILLSKYAGRAGTNYALLAGYTEIGETVEQTVCREVWEEVGLRVKNIRYYKSQPWAFTDTLLMGFYCELDGKDEITLDREELAAAEWFEREEIPVEALGDSLTNEMIIMFKNKKAGGNNDESRF